jgi:hypothetical protein
MKLHTVIAFSWSEPNIQAHESHAVQTEVEAVYLHENQAKGLDEAVQNGVDQADVQVDGEQDRFVAAPNVRLL